MANLTDVQRKETNAVSKVHVEAKDGARVTEDEWNFCSLMVGPYIPGPLHLGEGIRVKNFCRPDGEGEVALTVETDSVSFVLEFGLMGDSLNGILRALPTDEKIPVLVQEAFEGGRVRRSEFISWWLPLEESDDLVMEELMRSEERNTLTGSKEGLVWESRVPVYHPRSTKELMVTWTYRARRV